MRIPRALRALCFLCALPAWSAPAAPDPAAEYAARAGKLSGGKDARAWLVLADFAEKHLLLDSRQEALRKALEIDPQNKPAHARLEEVKLGSDWLSVDEADAREIAEQEAKKLVFHGSRWMPPKEAEAQREADRREAGWPVQVRLDTPRLKIYSGQSLAFTRKLAAALEHEIDAYQQLYGKVWKLEPKPKPFRVCLYSDYETFRREGTRLNGSAPPELAPAFYHGPTKTLQVGSRIDPADGTLDQHLVLSCALHEMVHAMDDQLAHLLGPSMPIWVAEGRAEHFRLALVGRHLFPGAVRIPRADGLRAQLSEGLPSLSLPSFLAMDQASFCTGNVPRNYALAFALVHFLFHAEGGKRAAGFQRFLAGLPGKRAVSDFEGAVGSLSALEADFKRYAQEQLIPAGNP